MGKRRRRQRQSSPSNIVLTDGDFELLMIPNVERIVRTRHMATLTGRPLRSVNRSLNRLYDHSYLDRLPGTREHGHQANPDDLHVLDERGARLLRSKGFYANPYSGKGKQDHVTHSLIETDFIVKAEFDCRNSDGEFRFHSQQALLGGVGIDDHRQSLLISADIEDAAGVSETQVTVADRLFAIEHVPTGAFRYWFLEADAHTEPIKRFSNPDLSSVFRKFLVFNQFAIDMRAEDQFGFRFFGVLFLTSGSSDYAQSVRRKVQPIYRTRQGTCPGRKTWLFANKQSILNPKHNILTAPWFKGSGGTQCLAGFEVSQQQLLVVN